MASANRLAGMALGVTLAAALGAGLYIRATRDAAAQPPARDTVAAVANALSTFPSDPVMGVEGAEVIEGTLVLAVTAWGEAEAGRRALLAAEVGGTVDRVAVREADPVAGGELLVALDAADQQLALDDARAQVREAEGQYRERLLFDGDLPADVRRDREAAVRLHSGLERASIQLRRARLNLERTRIRAPFGGLVASVQVVAGQRVAQGSEIMTVLDVDPTTVQVHVLESDLAHLAPGGGAEVHFSAFPDEAFAGRIEAVNPLVDQQTRSARVTVRVANPAGRILPGMYARVKLDSRRLADRILVPRRAILERDGRTMLFVHEGGRAKWRYVTTGLSNEEYVELVDDSASDEVAAGEVVLTGGHFTLTHGARIRLVESNGADVRGGA